MWFVAMFVRLDFCKSYLPVGKCAPEWRRQKFDEGPTAHQETTLSCVHAHLLEVDAHQREKRPECWVKEEVKALDYEKFLVDWTKEHLQDVGFSTDLVGSLLGLGVPRWQNCKFNRRQIEVVHKIKNIFCSWLQGEKLPIRKAQSHGKNIVNN